VRAWAEGRGLPAADAELFATAVAETAAALAPLDGTALLWGEAPACVCELRSARRVDDPLAGFVPPSADGPGLWYARQVCAYVDIRDDSQGGTVRLQYA
jgi:hypothetical protein